MSCISVTREICVRINEISFDTFEGKKTVVTLRINRLNYAKYYIILMMFPSGDTVFV